MRDVGHMQPRPDSRRFTYQAPASRPIAARKHRSGRRVPPLFETDERSCTVTPRRYPTTAAEFNIGRGLALDDGKISRHTPGLRGYWGM